jgi:AcrR family transcriptional regulator
VAPKLTDTYTDLRKEQILAAAWDCFVEKGYQETTMREIARRLGASTGVIYTYFQGKEEVLEAILAQSLERNRRRFDDAGRSVATAGAIRELFSSYLECCPVAVLKRSAQGNIGLWAEALKQKGIGRTVSTYLTGLRDSIAGIVRSSIERAQMPAGTDPNLVAGFYLAFYLGLELELALVEGLDSPQYIEGIRKLLYQLRWKKPVEEPEAQIDQPR